MDDKPVLSVRQTLAAAMDAMEAQAKAIGRDARTQAKAEAMLAKAETELIRAQADADAAAAKAKHLAARAALAQKTRDERAKTVADGLPKGRPL